MQLRNTSWLKDKGATNTTFTALPGGEPAQTFFDQMVKKALKLH